MNKTTQTTRQYQAQEWDTDCECWQDMEHDGATGSNRADVLAEAQYQARKCAYRVKVRVIEA